MRNFGGDTGLHEAQHGKHRQKNSAGDGQSRQRTGSQTTNNRGVDQDVNRLDGQGSQSRDGQRNDAAIERCQFHSNHRRRATASLWGMKVDVVDFLAPDAPQRFAESLHLTGFAVLVNHPLAQPLVQQIYDEWLAFFNSDAKYAYRYSSESGGGYYGPEISETAKGNDVRDIKEFFHVYLQGQYPTEVSDAALQFRDQATALALTLLAWVEQHTPPEIAELYSCPLNEMMIGSTRTLLRVLRYPPLTGNEPANAVRAAAHEDINLLTVLPASNEPGLQVRDRAGNWHDVPCDFGSLAINCGDMLALASGGFFPSTTHRVMNPTGEGAKRSRLSLPLFLHPADDVILADGRTAFSFLNERLAELRSQDNRTS
jgi:isopenicillin N synthase-like dioxygenase